MVVTVADEVRFIESSQQEMDCVVQEEALAPQPTVQHTHTRVENKRVNQSQTHEQHCHQNMTSLRHTAYILGYFKISV